MRGIGCFIASRNAPVLRSIGKCSHGDNIQTDRISCLMLLVQMDVTAHARVIARKNQRKAAEKDEQEGN